MDTLESARTLKKLAAIMGLLQEDAASFLSDQKGKMLLGLDIDEQSVLALIDERYRSRIEKNWKRSDEIRDELLAKGIELKDSPEGTTWGIKRS